MDVPASPPSFSFPRITRRRRNTAGAPPAAPQAQSPGGPPPQLAIPAPAQVPTTSIAPSPASPSAAAHPPTAAPPLSAADPSSRQSFRIRLVPHLETARSLHFEPIIRDVRNGGPPLRVGRFTDRATNPPRGNGLNPNDRSSDKVAFRSKVVSRAHAELWVQGKGVFFLKDTKSSSGTFINHMRLSPPGQESTPHILKDGDIIQLGVDYQGGTEEMYRCVKIKVEVGQGREWQGGANAFNTAALKQLRTLQAVETTGKGKAVVKKTVGDCCICLFTVSVCQSLFIAPCSHAFHYKCIRPLLELHHPGFSCPLCRTFADLEADVEVDESELKAIEDALDEAEEDELVVAAPEDVQPNGKGKGTPGASPDDAIDVDSDTGGSHGKEPSRQTGNRVPAMLIPTASAVPTLTRQRPSTGADDDRQVEDELEVDFDEEDDERMVSGSADEFGGRLQADGEDYMDTTYSPDKRNGHMPFSNNSRGHTPSAGPSNARDIPLRINSSGIEETAGEREARELADAATPLNTHFMAMATSLMGAVEQGPTGAGPSDDISHGWGQISRPEDPDQANGGGSSSGTTGSSPANGNGALETRMAGGPTTRGTSANAGLASKRKR